MQKLLHKFCFSDSKNGLMIVDMPTGTGKTHNTIEFIYKNYNKIENKIIFITNLKKNLPLDKLEEFFKKDNRLDDYNRDVLYLDNNVDTLIENFKEVENLIPKDKYSKNNILNNVKSSVKLINTLKDSLSKKSKQDFNSIGSKENAYFIMNQAREDLKEKYEKEFRELIEENLRFDEQGRKRTKAQKLELIKTNKEYKWIEKLYPAVLTDDKKIIFMSIDKFLVRNSSIVEPSYNIIDNMSLLKNSIIFIDEFDASKEILLKSIIRESLDTQVSVVELFRIIYAGLENTEFSKLLTEVSESLKTKIDNKKGRFYTPDQILLEFRQRAKDIEQKYKLVNYHKLDATEKEKSSFLFQDYMFHTVLGDSKTIYLENDKDSHINWIKRSEKVEISEENNIFLLLKDIKSFLSYFQNGVKLIADNYLYLKRERNQETNNFSYEASIKTVLSEFGIEGRYLNYLASQIKNSSKRTSSKIVDLKSELDCSVYEKGFRFYNFVDSDTFDTQSKINYLSFNLSPEKILIYLCSNSKVIGISASGTLETVTGNYDLKYIKKKLGSTYYEIDKEDQDRINADVNHKIGNYKNVNVEVDKCNITDKNYKDFLISVFEDEKNYNSILERLKDLTSDDFVKARYCKAIYAINKFFEKGIQSFLFITNTAMKSGLDFNYEFIQDVFTLLKPANCDAYCYSLEGSLGKFENTKNSINKMLKNGKRMFVVSTYQTLGAGQNLQYEFNEEFADFIETISDEDYSKNFKDFDAIFLDKPTNLFVNLNKNPTEDQLLKFIYQVKCLEEVGYFNLDKATEEIKKGIQIFYHASPKKIEIPKSKHIYMHTAKVILQAVGRICRTNNKSKNIFICFDQQIEKDLSQVKDELLKRPINYELKKLLEECQDYEQIFDSPLNNINNSKIIKINDKIESMKRFNSPSDITKWEELREIVIKYPFDNFNIHNEYDIYCELEKVNNHYYCQRTDSQKYLFTEDKHNDICICEDLANLKVLMQIPQIKDYFENKGYATNFEKSKFILLPNVFNRIYLGALGEVVGEFLVNRYLNKFGMNLERITSLERYEKFDFVFDNDKYIDFKYWTGITDKDRQKEVDRIIKKLDKCNGSIGFIVNILKPANYNPKEYESQDGRLIIIPYLYDPQTKTWNMEGLSLLTNKII